MHFKSKVMILDEPTNHLSVKETKKVIGFVRGLKEQGITGVFISHNMHHVFECCDRVVAMARGEIVLDKRMGRPRSRKCRTCSDGIEAGGAAARRRRVKDRSKMTVVEINEPEPLSPATTA